MPPQPLDGFRHFETHHCVTGSMRHIYAFNGFDVSEEMLLGIGEGVGFGYWHQKNALPFLGGRAQPRPSMEEITGERTGVKINIHTSSSAQEATESLVKMLEAGQPVMLLVDMGFLPYFDFGGEEYHFGGHAIVACGYDAATDEVLVADRDTELLSVPMADLEKARSSKFEPFPPGNRWYTFDFSEMRHPAPDEVYLAIKNMSQGMLAPPLPLRVLGKLGVMPSLGVKGIRNAAEAIPKWSQTLDAEQLRFALFNAHIFISPVGGTGGGSFRYMLSRFLREAATIAGDEHLNESAESFQYIGDKWEAVGEWCKRASESDNPASLLMEAGAPLNELADLEKAAWSRLREIAESR